MGSNANAHRLYASNGHQASGGECEHGLDQLGAGQLGLREEEWRRGERAVGRRRQAGGSLAPGCSGAPSSSVPANVQRGGSDTNLLLPRAARHGPDSQGPLQAPPSSSTPPSRRQGRLGRRGDALEALHPAPTG